MNRDSHTAAPLRTIAPLRASLHRFIRRFVRVSADADDIVQEAYLKLLERPGAERDGKAVPGYLFVIARNLAADSARRNSRENRRAAALHTLTTQLQNAEPGAEEMVFIEQASERLRTALWELPERSRDAFLLHRFEGLTHAEIAKRMNVTTRTAERDIAAALAHLKNIFFSREGVR